MERIVVKDSSRYYVFGAHPRGHTFYEYMKLLEPQCEMLGFLFDNDEINPDRIDGNPVINMSYISKNDDREADVGYRSNNSSECVSTLDKEAKVYIATRGEYHNDIIERLSLIGFRDIECVTPELDVFLRNRYVEILFKKNGRKFNKIDAIIHDDLEVKDNDAFIYIAKSIGDRDFHKHVDLYDYEHIMQVGCVLTETKLLEAEFFDGGEDNISSRNSQSCELTALYWIWRHARQKIVGLEHWRRRFKLPDDWVELMDRDGIDVILPVPLCVMPSLEDNFKSRHVSKVWDVAMEILHKIHPEDYERAREYFKNNTLYSPCNMLIARKNVLDEYCAWMFPVILELNDRVGMIEDKYQNRYPGFVSERLLTYFFDVNSDKYKVAYADKSFLK